MDLDCVTAFVAVMEQRDYVRAGRQLFLSPSSVSRRIQRLERQVGVRLVQRDSGGTAGPTAAGARFLPHALTVLENARTATQAARCASGVVRLGVPGAVGEYPPRTELAAVGALLRTWVPGLRLRCTGIAMPDLNSCLHKEQVDVVWTIEVPPTREIAVIPLVAVARLGVIGPQHPLVDAPEVGGDEFATVPMLYDSSLPTEWMGPWHLGDLRPVRAARLRDIRARTLTDVLDQVKVGPEATVVHAPLAVLLPDTLHTVRLTGTPAIRYAAAQRRSDRRPSVQTLVAAMRQVARNSADGAPSNGRPRL